MGCEAVDYLGVARQLRLLGARSDRRAGAGDLPERGGTAVGGATTATWTTWSLTVSSPDGAELTMIRGWGDDGQVVTAVGAFAAGLGRPCGVAAGN